MFHFKKFSIDDSTAAMKIGTDSVLLGAWVACENETRILDIGTGSGILALMMAQRNRNVPVDAVELDSDASALAKENIDLSPWSSQIQIYNISFQDFYSERLNKYSMVICNPPFFTGSMKANGKARTLARHNDTLPVSDLLRITSEILTENGRASFIIPTDAYKNWIHIAGKQFLFPTNLTSVKSSQFHKPHRMMVTFSRCEMPVAQKSEISIYRSRSIYSEEYKDLTKDFYLNF
jgi:tRNA1Val (adenine37-N6)-methyltransferase